MKSPPRPPPGAEFDLIEMYFSMSAEQAEAIAGASELPLLRTSAQLAEALSAIANRWLLHVTAQELGGLPRGAPPSERATWCDGVARAADDLLVQLGAGRGADDRYPVVTRIRSGQYRTQINPHSQIQAALGNLIGYRESDTPVDQTPDDTLLSLRSSLELHFAPALSTATKPGEFGESRRVDEDVLRAAIAAVALIRGHAQLSAAGWRARASRRAKGGRRPNAARRAAAHQLAVAFEWATGTSASPPTPRIKFAAFMSAFCEWMAASSRQDSLEAFGADGPNGVTMTIIEDLMQGTTPGRKPPRNRGS